MNRLKAGAIVLSVWSGLNLLVALAVTAMMLVGRTAPVVALVLSESDARRVDANALAIINAQAAVCNPCIAALCAMVLALVWRGVMARARWAMIVLVAALVPLQAAGFASDAFLAHRNLVANVASAVLLLVGLGLAGTGLQRGSARPDENTLDSAGASD